jgi:hypothetical protein
MEIIKFIQATPALKPLLRFHNITKQGIPSKSITRVPTLVTEDKKLLVGGEVKQWLISMMPCDFSEFEGWGPMTANIDNSEPDLFFSLDSYGESLKPNISPELQARIDANVSDSYASLPKPT